MPSTGAICRSMTITSGRRPSDSIVASTSSACALPAACATTSMSGSLPRNASRPRRTTSWSSTTRTAMDSSLACCISVAVPVRRHAHPHDGSLSRRAPYREPPAHLGRPAAHRLQPEVTRVSGLRLEAAPVVADLDDDLLPLSFHTQVDDRGLGVPHGIRERLPADREQLRLDLLGER